jgi:hypothetical protein
MANKRIKGRDYVLVQIEVPNDIHFECERMQMERKHKNLKTDDVNKHVKTNMREIMIDLMRKGLRS